MDKNKQQLIILGIIVAVLIVATAKVVLKPRSFLGKSGTNSEDAAAAAPAAEKPSPQKGRVTSSFKSWGRDPFAIGGGPAEAGSGTASLTGIFCDPKESYCIIGGKVAKVGDEVSGYKILEITEDHVTVKAGDEIRTLRIGR